MSTVVSIGRDQTEALDAREFTVEQCEELRACVEDLTADLQQPPERQQWSRIKATAKAVGDLASIAPSHGVAEGER